MKVHCKEKYDRQSFFLLGSVKEIGYFFCGYGAYASLLLQTALFKGQSGVKTAKENVCLKQAGIFLVLLALAIGPLAIIFEVKVKNVWANLLLKKALTIIVLQLLIGGFIDRIAQWLKLYDTVEEEEPKTEFELN